MSNYCVFKNREVKEISYEKLNKLIEEKKVVLVYGHGEGYTSTAVHIFNTTGGAAKFAEKDTRGECYSMWDEQWAEIATNKFDVFKACRC